MDTHCEVSLGKKMLKMPPPRVFDSFLKLCLYRNTRNQSQLSVKDTKVSDVQ